MKREDALKIQQQLIANIKEMRLKQGISHERLAAMCGLHRTAISHIENGIRNPSLINCIRIADALGYSLSELLAKSE